MWFVADGDRLLVITDAHSAKVKRIRRNPQVTVAACRANGRLTGEPRTAQARILPSSEHERAQKMLEQKYRLEFILILPVYNLVQWMRGRRQSSEIAVLAITPRDLG
jgi:PPOX class probable F420-dependent enzyme